MKDMHTVFSSPDLVELLADDPELLAIADSIATTQAMPRRRLPVRQLMIAAAIVAAAVLALMSPWQEHGNASLIARALAAVGDGPTIHAVLAVGTGADEIDLSTGSSRPQQRHFELWLDTKRNTQHTQITVDGTLEDNLMQSPAGGIAATGAIYSCAWIARHPDEAAQARVSCTSAAAGGRRNANGGSLDPALTRFADGYRNSLIDGSAQRIGSGTVAGKAVTWLEIYADGRSERVAVDEQTAKPVLVEPVNGGDGPQYRVELIETLPADQGNFVAPISGSIIVPSSGSRTEERTIAAAAAESVVPQAAIPGRTIRGLRLRSVTVTDLVTTFTNGHAPSHDKGVEFEYGGDDAAGTGAVRVQEAATPQMAYGWFGGATPKPGILIVNWYGGMLVHDGLFVSIRSDSRDLIIAAAHAVVSH